MKSTKSKFKEERTINLTSNPVVYFITIVSLFFLPTIQDPFNVSKIIVLYLFAAWCFVSCILNFHNILYGENRLIYLIYLIFILFLFLSAILTDSKFIAFFGEQQRKNGFFTYFSLAIISVYIIENFNKIFLKKIFNAIFFVSLITCSYGLLQLQGKDFIKWNNPYNSIITTMGNPNFASALFGILGTMVLINFFGENSYRKKMLSVLLFFLIVFLTYRSESKQGLVALSVGIGFGFFILMFKRNRRLSIFYLILYVVLFIFMCLGMLNQGPLKNLMYKESVSIRGFYWRASFKMFQDHPLFGVGIDSFGSFFKQYREPGYSLKYGYQITSTNAHSVPLQFLSTTGIFVFILYISIILITLYSGLKALKKYQGQDFFRIAAMLSGYITFLAQSFISIDQIALGAWGAVLSGLLIGSFLERNRQSDLKKQIPRFALNSYEYKLLKVNLVSVFGILIVSFPCYFLYLGDNQTWVARNMFSSLNNGSQVQENINLVIKKCEEVKNIPLQSPSNKLLVSTFELNLGNKTDGIKTIKALLKSDPRNTDYLNILAIYNEEINNLNDAIRFRNRIEILDPYNAENLLNLGLIYKKKGELENMILVKEKIIKMVGHSKFGNLVAQQLT